MIKDDLSDFTVNEIDRMIGVLIGPTSSIEIYGFLIDDYEKRPLNSLIALLLELEHHLKSLGEEQEIADMEATYLGQFHDYTMDDVRKTYFLDSKPLDIYKECIGNSIFPPAELLNLLDSIFRSYFYSKGSVELENLFFGKLSKKGNFSSQKARMKIYSRFDQFCTFERFMTQPSAENITLSEMYRRFKTNDANSLRGGLNHKIKDMTKEDIEYEDSFLRGYRRWNRGK